MRKRWNVVQGCLFLVMTAPAAVTGQTVPDPDVTGPSFEAVVGLTGVGDVRISPDGRRVVYTLRKADFEENRFDTEIWLAGGAHPPKPLTYNPEGNSTSPIWTPDGRSVAFLSDRGSGTQVYLINPDGGEARRLTEVDGGVEAFAFSPDGGVLALRILDPRPDGWEAREQRFGSFSIEDAEFRVAHLWVAEAREGAKPRRLTEGVYHVGSFAWSPDGERIAFDHRPTPRVDDFPLADISVVEVASGSVQPLVNGDGPDTTPVWSPTGREIAYTTTRGNAFYGNNELVVRPLTGEDRQLSQGFDERLSPVAWVESGIWFVASQRTERRVFVLDPSTGTIEMRRHGPSMIGGVDLSPDGRHVVVTGSSSTTLTEVYLGTVEGSTMERLTDVSAEISDWPLGGREVITWESEDGEPIEGVLWTPPEFDRGRRYPLFVVIHGGPTGTSRPTATSVSTYPVHQWVARGAMVLMPNYRGSAGYGARFRALNVRNLGIGDAWDVESGVEHLVREGVVDPERVGVMGWSQGGYISAFLATNSTRFRAISVGAGISNWMTYYVNTDIHRFTREYLGATPWDDPDIYARTSPMTNIRNARTPTLIQHGEFDARVPTPNAYELYQGLQDVGVATRLIIYTGFGHGITKPRERVAAMQHNWEWFERYLWGDP